MYFCINPKKHIKICCIFLIIIVAFVSSLLTFKSNFIRINADNSGIFVPIIMYHSVLPDVAKQGKWQITPELLESDLKYLSENGYKTVTPQDLIDYVSSDTELPLKPVMITFDDGFYNTMNYGLPLLEKYDMKAVISVVGDYSENYCDAKVHSQNYSYVNWEDIKKLKESKRFEIANHTYNLHNNKKRNGIKKISGESISEYITTITDDLTKLQNTLTEKSDVTPTTFTYPFGAISSESSDILKKLGFKCTLTCYEKPNFITKDPSCLFGLNRYNRGSGMSTTDFMKRALKCQN